MTLISEKFADELSEKQMRDAYLAAQTRTKVAAQIRAIRSQRGWSQGEFSRLLGKPQSNVSRLESREYGQYTLSTLLELASAFDVGLTVEFVPYQDFLKRTHDLAPKTLEVSSFSRADLEPLCTSEMSKITPDIGQQTGFLQPLSASNVALPPSVRAHSDLSTTNIIAGTLPNQFALILPGIANFSLVIPGIYPSVVTRDVEPSNTHARDQAISTSPIQHQACLNPLPFRQQTQESISFVQLPTTPYNVSSATRLLAA